jgi:hypothetical protein
MMSYADCSFYEWGGEVLQGWGDAVQILATSTLKSGVQGTESHDGVRGVPALILSSRRAVGPQE